LARLDPLLADRRQILSLARANNVALKPYGFEEGNAEAVHPKASRVISLDAEE
jgi:hypothetical protein